MSALLTNSNIKQIGSLSEPFCTVDIEGILDVFDGDVESAYNVVSSLYEGMLAKKHFTDSQPKIDLSSGTYEKCVQFKGNDSAIVTYNEGTTKEIELSSEGIYFVGEKTRVERSSLEGSKEIVEKHHFQSFSSVVGSGLLDVATESLMDGIYTHFPNARRKSPDSLYHPSDKLGMFTRTEVFRSYVSSAVKDFLSGVPDVYNVLIFEQSSTKVSATYFRRVIAEVNECRTYPLYFACDREGFDLKGYSYTYVFKNPFSLQALNAGYIPTNDLNSLDTWFEEELEGYSDFIGVNSSFVFLAYKPVFQYNCTSYGLPYDRLSDHDISNTIVTPHKLWSLVQICPEESDYFVDGNLHSRMEESIYLASLYSILGATYHVNIIRNMRLASQEHDTDWWYSNETKFRKDCMIALKRCKYMGNRFSYPVYYKSKPLSVDTDYSLQGSVNIAVSLSKMTGKVRYSPDDMNRMGWREGYIRRALILGLIHIDKAHTQYRYYKDEDRRFGTEYDSVIFGDVEVEEKTPSISFVLPDGSVYSNELICDGVAFASPKLMVRKTHYVHANNSRSSYISQDVGARKKNTYTFSNSRKSRKGGGKNGKFKKGKYRRRGNKKMNSKTGPVASPIHPKPPDKDRAKNPGIRKSTPKYRKKKVVNETGIS